MIKQFKKIELRLILLFVNILTVLFILFYPVLWIIVSEDEIQEEINMLKNTMDFIISELENLK